MEEVCKQTVRLAREFVTACFRRYSAETRVTNSSLARRPPATIAAMTEPKTKILVVDDDLRLRDLLNRYLTEQGFAVRTVSRRARAWTSSLAHERFDLMVLDLMLPGEDGLSICRRLRGTRNDIPIVMLTAKGEDVDRIVGLEMGADDYLPKPFNPRELVARINAVLRRRRRAAAARARPPPTPSR